MIRTIDPRGYLIPMTGHPLLHENLSWFATEDDAVLGVVIRDRVDRDFGWVVMTQNDQGPGYSAVDLGCSLPSAEQATAELHIAMERERGE
jgi:hypothetical protein